MVGELVNVLEQSVEIRGGSAVRPSANRGGHRDRYRNVGGFALGLNEFGNGLGVVSLRPNGTNTVEEKRYFGTSAEACAEHDRLDALLWSREWVAWVAGALVEAAIVPAEFLPAVRSGAVESLLVAADWQDERDAPDAAILLRAAYHRITGTANVVVRAGKRRVILLNPQRVTPKRPAVPGTGGCRAAVIEEGQALTILAVVARSAREPGTNRWTHAASAVESRPFGIGSMAEYDSYNLVYFAPVESVTAKSVVIGGGHRGKKTRLTIGAFVEKNHDFDLAAARKRNNEWSD